MKLRNVIQFAVNGFTHDMYSLQLALLCRNMSEWNDNFRPFHVGFVVGEVAMRASFFLCQYHSTCAQ